MSMERGQLAEQPKKEVDRYAQFADGQRKFAAELGHQVLDVAHEGKQARETEQRWTQERVEQYQQKLERLREDINGKKKNLISRVLHHKQLRELRNDLRRNENIVAQYAEEQQWRQEMIAYYDRIIAEEEQMGKLMEDAHLDNEQFDEAKRIELQEEEKERSIVEQARKHNVFFVSDIVTAEWKPSANNRVLDTKALEFEDQLHVILGLDPTISASTLSPGSRNRTFGTTSWGVFLSGGRIIGGEQGDAGSVARGLRERYFSKPSRSVAAINEAIERPSVAGGKTQDGSYNELGVENPEVGGVYFKLETDDLPSDMQTGQEISLPRQYGEAWWAQIGAVMQTGAPLFAIERNNNTVRMVYDIDLASKTFKLTPPYAPENIVNMPGIYKQHLDPDHRRRAVGQVFDKTAHLLPAEERAMHEQNLDKPYSGNYINVH